MGATKTKKSRYGYPKTDEEIYVENSTYARHNLKRKIISGNKLPYSCQECGNTGSWLNKKLVLHLDHINGVNNDNRITNLRFLCPNCHSQQDTYCAKNIIKQKGE